MSEQLENRRRTSLIRAPTFFDEAGDRASALELFFDLVFVFCVSQLARHVHEDPGWVSAAQIVLLFAPVWWTWTNVMFLANRFPADDVIERALVLLAAAASAVMGLALTDTPGEHSSLFALGYAVGRLVVAALYVRAARAVPATARNGRWMVAGTLTSAALWLVSIALPSPVQYVLWIVAMAIDVATPALLERRFGLLPVDVNHMPERTSAFVVIALGESLVSTLTAAVDHGFDGSSSVLVLCLTFVLTAALWWGFFDWRAMQARLRSLHGDHGGRMANIIYGYLHFPVVLGVAFVAVGLRLAEDHAAETIPPSAALALAGGCVIYLLAINAITLVLRVPRSQSLRWPRLLLAAALVLVAVLGRTWPTPLYLAVCAVVLIAHVPANLNRVRVHGTAESV